MPLSKEERLHEFEARADLMYDVYPDQTRAIIATVDLVRENPRLTEIGHELFHIIAENEEVYLSRTQDYSAN
jgi:hypothetical protein